MNCQRIQKEFQENMKKLLAKYKDQGSSEEILESMLIENTNFVMLEMLKECLALSREPQDKTAVLT